MGGLLVSLHSSHERVLLLWLENVVTDLLFL